MSEIIDNEFFVNINNTIPKNILNKFKHEINIRHFLIKKNKSSVRDILIKYGYYYQIVKIRSVMKLYYIEKK